MPLAAWPPIPASPTPPPGRQAVASGWDEVLLPLDVDLSFVEDVAYRQADRLDVDQLLRYAADVEALAAAPDDPGAERPGHRRRRMRYARMGDVYRRVVAERRFPARP